ncbi:hypothetical protein KIPB_003899 [Kipferlia bialata]|uniref:Uncharacterized protein n=1 Tax=Kipferlia bialata TaxID=797122 RepID=A0A9K3CTN1_9EUKA|nr:hypothetical protein KIPB_003899 [Kipferlia bialata]|eukprot:g3899.t1
MAYQRLSAHGITTVFMSGVGVSKEGGSRSTHSRHPVPVTDPLFIDALLMLEGVTRVTAEDAERRRTRFATLCEDDHFNGRYSHMSDAAAAALQCLSRTTVITAMRTVHKALTESGDPVRVRLSLPAADPIPAGGAVVWRCVEGVRQYLSVAGESDLAMNTIDSLQELQTRIRQCGSTMDVQMLTRIHRSTISTAVAMCLAYSDQYGSGAGRANSMVKWGQCHSLVHMSKRKYQCVLERVDPGRSKVPRGARGTRGSGYQTRDTRGSKGVGRTRDSREGIGGRGAGLARRGRGREKCPWVERSFPNGRGMF